MSRKVAIVGATGMVGREALNILDSSKTPYDLRLFATERSAGVEMPFRGRALKVEIISEAPQAFKGIEAALFCADGSVARELAPRAVEQGCWVVDNSSAFRLDPDVPLVIPTVNGHLVDKAKRSGKAQLVANPNCSAIQMCMALKALHDSFGIEDVIMSSYQAMSGAGKDAVEELLNLSRQVVESYDKSQDKMSFHRNYASGLKAKAQPRVSAFNLFPQIGPLDNLGWSDEEQKIMKETRKILNLVDLSVTATAVRTPVINGHSQSVAVTLTKSASVSEVQDALAKAPLCRVVRDPQAYPTPAEVTGTDDVVIGKVRQDESRERRFHFWVVADNLRVGAALNAYRIMEKILS